MRNLLKFNTIFSRIMFFNLVIVILATVVPQVVFFNYFATTYDSEIKKYNMQNARKLQTSIDETLIKRVVDIPNAYFSEIKSNEVLTYPLNFDIKSRQYRIAEVSQRLADISSTMDFVISIDIYYMLSNLLFEGTNVYFVGDESTEKVLDRKWLETLSKTDEKVMWIPYRQTQHGEMKIYSVYARSIPYFSDRKDRRAVIAVNIDERAIYNQMSLLQGSEAGNLLVVNSDGTVVSHSQRELVGKSLINQPFADKILSAGKEGSFDITINGHLSTVSFVKSSYNDWKYISVTSIDDLKRKSTQLKNYLILISAILLLFNVLVSIFLTRKAHKPLNAIIHTVSGIAKLMGNEGDTRKDSEYRLMDNTVKNLASQIYELNDRLEENRTFIYNNLIMKLLNGKIDMGQQKPEASIPGIVLDKDQLFCFKMKIYHDRNLGYHNRIAVSLSIIELLQDINGEAVIKAVLDEEDQIVGIANFDSSVSESEITKRMMQEVENLLISNYTICIGSSYPSSYEVVTTSYQEACECYKYAFLNQTDRVLQFRELHTESLKGTGSALKILDKIVEAIKTGDEEKLKFSINGILESIQAGVYSIEYCKNTLMDVVSTIRKAVVDMGHDEVEVFGCDIREYYKRIEHIEDFRTWIYGVIAALMLKTNEKRHKVSSELDTGIKKYLEDNIFNDISLTTMSESLGISPNYLSKMFKVVTGTNFSEYVTEMKLQKAAELLEEGKMQVKDIAVKLGYNTPHHFIKLFKERYGTTPKEYQKNTGKR